MVVSAGSMYVDIMHDNKLVERVCCLQDKGLRCRLNIPWTLLLDGQGRVTSSWITNKVQTCAAWPYALLNQLATQI